MHIEENAIIVGVSWPGSPHAILNDDSLKELTALASTAGLHVVESARQRMTEPNPATFIGKGKVDELKRAAPAQDVTTIIFDEELSPAQQRNLEDIFGENIKVIDRTALILDIFAQHARTREGQIQVELAQYEYRLPRLTRMWVHLARQAGGRSAGASGVGVRGPGEMQLEVDRRRIKEKIARLKRDLEQVRRERRRHRESRRRSGYKVIALAGYTNAGKSSLLNAFCDAGVTVEDKLFATLDPTTRRVKLPHGRVVLVTDTVGFINKLPHHLVASFRATFEGITEADIILHVADVSHPSVLTQVAVVEETLKNQWRGEKPAVLVWNKIDLLSAEKRSHLVHNGMVAISAKTGLGVDRLLQRIEDLLHNELHCVEVELPYSRWELVHNIYELGTVTSIRHGGASARIRAYVPETLFPLLKPFI
jgi:GTP-binding protein HflX